MVLFSSSSPVSREASFASSSSASSSSLQCAAAGGASASHPTSPSLPSFDCSYKEKTSYSMQDDDDDPQKLQPPQSPSSSFSSPASSHLSASLSGLHLAKAGVSSDHKSSLSPPSLPCAPSSPPSPFSSSSSSTPSSSFVSPLADAEEEKYTAFLSWLRVNGAKFPHLTLRRYARDYRGVHIASKAEIVKGKTLLRIPHALLITVELAKASPIGGLVASLPNIGSQAILAVYLLQERGKGAASFWRHWLDVLPASFSSLPMFFSAAELGELSGCTELLLKVRSQQKSMRDEYNSIMRLPGIGAFPAFSYDDFVWAALAVGTRVFSLCINGAKTSVLAPLADMMNHKNPAGSSWSYCNRKEAFTLTACCNMFDGEAVYESYGVKDNKRFFASYGFCLDDNAANEVCVVIKGELMVDERQSRSFTVRQCYDGAMEEMMSFLRMVNAYEYQVPEDAALRSATPSSSSQSQSQSAHFSAFARSSFTIPLSVDNELSALYALRCACKEHLSAYPTKLDHDIALLQALPDTEASTNMRNILVFRIGEKRIYKWLIDFSSLGIALLCMPWEEARTKIKVLMERPGGAGGAEEEANAGMMGYISGVVAPLLQERNKAVRRGGAPVARGPLVGRRLSQDVDRKMMGIADFVREMENDDEDDDDDRIRDHEDDDDGRDTDSDEQSHPAFFASPDGAAPPAITPPGHLTPLSASAASFKRSSLTGGLPPVVAAASRFAAVTVGTAGITTPARASLTSSFSLSPSLSPSSSPPATYTSRHLPRSATSSRPSVPRILPAMAPAPVTRSASYAASASAASVSAVGAATGIPKSAPFLPSRSSAPAAEHSAGAAQQASPSSFSPAILRLSAPSTGSHPQGCPGSDASSKAPAQKGVAVRSTSTASKATGVRGGVVTAPSPTPSTSDDSQDEQTTPVDDASDTDEADDSRGHGEKAAAAQSERRRAVHCAQ